MLKRLASAFFEGFKLKTRRAISRAELRLGKLTDVYDLKQTLILLTTELKINCVIDVGAHEGEYGDTLRSLGYRGRIVSFEPVPESFSALSQRIAGDSEWRAHPFALGRNEGTAELNVYRGSTFSSFLTPSDFGADRFNRKFQVDRIETVAIRRLDGIFQECLAGIESPRVLLKVDTQGYDLAVLEGAEAAIGRVVALQTEVSVNPIYRGPFTTLTESIAHMQQLGFELMGLFPVSYDPKDRLRVVEFDCVMCRPGDQRSGESSSRRDLASVGREAE